MEIVRLNKDRKRALCILAALLVFFMTMLAACGVGVYNDSDQYITMHIHREPLYPLFLCCFRTVIGDGYLPAAMAVQGILTALGITVLSEYLTRRFHLHFWEEVLVVLLQLLPHLMTRYVSALHIFLENSVMSEALCIPLFQFFLYFLLRMIFEDRRRDRVLSLLMAYLLSMTRGQMMTTILMWAFIYCIGRFFVHSSPQSGSRKFTFVLHKIYRAVVVPLAVLLAVFGLRSLTVHVYNYFVTGYFMGNTYGQVNTLTNVIYACDKEDREVFEEGSLEQEFFDRFYAEADEQGLNYKYGGDTVKDRTAYLEEHHDILKFQVLEADMSSYFFGLGKVDYYEQSSMSDDMAGRMMRKLLPDCFGQWFYDYLLLCRNGFVRSIAVVHPLINWVALLFYLAAAGLTLYLICVKKRYEAAFTMGVALLFIAANVCATSITIMCLSRYMIYGFSIFYIAFYLLLREMIKDQSWYRKRKG